MGLNRKFVVILIKKYSTAFQNVLWNGIISEMEKRFMIY